MVVRNLQIFVEHDRQSHSFNWKRSFAGYSFFREDTNFQNTKKNVIFAHLLPNQNNPYFQTPEMSANF